MLKIIPIPEAAKAALLSRPSYYRLAAEWLMPPPIKIGPARAGVIKTELDAVILARIKGATNDEIKTLVRQLVADRSSLAESREESSVETAEGSRVEVLTSTPRKSKRSGRKMPAKRQAGL